LIAMLAISCHKKPRPAKVNQLDKSGLRQGEWHYHYPDGKLKEIVFFKDDIKSGAQKRYFENGQINLEMYWKQDSIDSWLDSVNRMYSEDGTLLLESYYHNGEPDSVFHIFYNSGSMKEEEHFRHGQKVGIWKYYREDGSLKKTIDYNGYEQYWSEDNTSGLITWYDEAGDTSKTETWMQGSQIEVKEYK